MGGWVCMCVCVQKEPNDKSCLLTLDFSVAIQIVGQRKAFCMQLIPESSCSRKKLLKIHPYNI